MNSFNKNAIAIEVQEEEEEHHKYKILYTTGKIHRRCL
jgi:hypothetical protein